jgi:hypothetical protein
MRRVVMMVSIVSEAEQTGQLEHSEEGGKKV